MIHSLQETSSAPVPSLQKPRCISLFAAPTYILQYHLFSFDICHGASDVRCFRASNTAGTTAMFFCLSSDAASLSMTLVRSGHPQCITPVFPFIRRRLLVDHSNPSLSSLSAAYFCTRRSIFNKVPIRATKKTRKSSATPPIVTTLSLLTVFKCFF